MLSKKITLSVLIGSILFLFPSCIKYYKLSKEEFPQGKEQPDKKEVTADNLKTVAIYDQFATKAIFDTLWLSNETRIAYVDINSEKRGRDEQARQALLRRQMEENKHWISFYVLSDVREKGHLSLSDKNSQWSFYVESQDGRKVMPISVKEVDIEPEYKFLFGSKFNLFKRVYLMKFPSTDLAGKRYLKKGKPFKLVISSPYKKREVEWNKTEEVVTRKKGKKITKKVDKKVLKNDDYYWV